MNAEFADEVYNNPNVCSAKMPNSNAPSQIPVFVVCAVGMPPDNGNINSADIAKRTAKNVNTGISVIASLITGNVQPQNIVANKSISSAVRLAVVGGGILLIVYRNSRSRVAEAGIQHNRVSDYSTIAKVIMRSSIPAFAAACAGADSRECLDFRPARE